jgi:S-adenosylmethionine-dependent methyltransferase
VTLVDISQEELDKAKLYAKESGVTLAGIICADANYIRDYPEVFKQHHYDIVLCQGPLYHLLSIDERIDLLRACKVAAKWRGMVIAAFVTKFAHLRNLAQKDPLRLSREPDFYKRYLDTGYYTRNPQTESFHTHREEVMELFEMCKGDEDEYDMKLDVQKVVACESFLPGGISEKLNYLDEEAFKPWLKVALEAAEDPDVGTADHLLVVARKTSYDDNDALRERD